jgi:hypothetical protein
MAKNVDTEWDFDADTFDASVGNVATDASDMVLDLSDVSERPKIEVLPAGIYDATIDSVELGNSQRSGNPMLTWTFRLPLQDGRERTMFYHTVLKDSGLNRLKRLIVRLQPFANEPIDVASFRPSEASLYFTGVPCRVRLRTQTYEGELRNSVSDVLAPENAETDNF